jgi:hypothetical protein
MQLRKAASAFVQFVDDSPEKSTILLLFVALVSVREHLDVVVDTLSGSTCWNWSSLLFARVQDQPASVHAALCAVLRQFHALKRSL